MFDEEQIAQMIGMKRAGIKEKEIAKRFKCSRNTVSRITTQLKCYSRIDGKTSNSLKYFPSQYKFDHLE